MKIENNYLHFLHIIKHFLIFKISVDLTIKPWMPK